MGGVVAPAGYKEPTGDSPRASECSDVFEAAEAEVERLNKTTSEKVALRHWTSDERINGYENEPSVWTRPTVEALLPYNRRRREGGATARARARARGGKEEKRPSRTALKQARAVKTGQVQLQRRAPRLPREHGGGWVSGTVRQPTWTPQASQITDLRINAGQKVYDRYTKNSAVQHHGGNPRICRCHPQTKEVEIHYAIGTPVEVDQWGYEGFDEEGLWVGSYTNDGKPNWGAGSCWEHLTGFLGLPPTPFSVSAGSHRKHRPRPATELQRPPSEVSLAFQPAPREQLRRRVDEQ